MAAAHPSTRVTADRRLDASRPPVPAAAVGPRAVSASEPESALLLRRLRQGDEAALEAILSEHWGPLVAYVVRIVGRLDTAEDVAQRTFLRLWERREGWSPDGSLKGLLFRIGRNLAISERRSGGARSRALDRMSIEAPRLPDRSPAEALADSELGRELERAIEALPERRREVFILRTMHGLSYAEIGTVMDISQQTVANQLSRGLASLRESLAHLLDDR